MLGGPQFWPGADAETAPSILWFAPIQRTGGTGSGRLGAKVLLRNGRARRAGSWVDWLAAKSNVQGRWWDQPISAQRWAGLPLQWVIAFMGLGRFTRLVGLDLGHLLCNAALGFQRVIGVLEPQEIAFR